MIIELMSKAELVNTVRRYTYRCISKHAGFVVGEDYFFLVERGKTFLFNEFGEIIWSFDGDNWKPYFKEN